MMNIRMVIILMLLVCQVSAVTINNIDIAIDETGHVNVRETLVVPRGTGFFETWIPGGVENLAVAGPSGPLDFNKTLLDNKTYLGVDIPVATKSGDVTLSYSSRYLTTKSGGVWTLKLNVPSNPRRTIVKINLPFNSTILDWEPKIPFSPNQDGLYVFPEVEEFNFTLNYRFGGGAPEQTNYNFMLVVALLVLLIVIIVLLRRRTKPEATEEKPVEGKKRVNESVIKTLEENERKIVELLQEAEEEITQATIYNETHIPKASLSDIMRRLEKRNIIERKREGRRNWVKLKDWVFE